jgi:cytochrome c-type biogenesis protein CcmE
MKARHKRLAFVAVILAGAVVATTLVLNAFRDNLVFFYSPTDIVDNRAPVERSFRIGGVVEDGSLRRETDGVTVHFAVTDTAATIPVIYKGVLPDLFREGQGVVAQGRLRPDGTFQADQVLAKHDETYMPPEAAEALERAQRERARVMQTEGEAEGQ